MLNDLKLNHFYTCSLFLMWLVLALTGCDRQEKEVSKQAILSELDVWVHTGNQEMFLLRKDQVARFNARHSRINVTLISIPKGTYGVQVNAATRTGTLPDIVELDGPSLASFADRGALMKLDKILTTTTRQDMLPAVFEQGMFQGRIYSIAETSDSSVLYARKSLLESVGYRIPVLSGDAWSMSEFETLSGLILKHEDYSASIDVGLNNLDESLTVTLYPMLLSAGGAIINEQAPYQVDGILNSARNIAFLTRFQHWIEQGYVYNGISRDAFIDGRVPLAWAGLDKFSSYKAQFGDDLIVVPLPDFGFGSQYVQKSWGWGLTRNCEDTQAAMRFLEFLFLPEEVHLAAQASGGLPGTYSALASYGAVSDRPLIASLINAHQKGEVYSQLKSSLYPVIDSAFHKAFVRIKNGVPVAASLEAAIGVIDQQRKNLESELAEINDQES
ncbi:MAG: extracellular solute-binding protein [Gammaproteobacteria bacterium]|nr:extracellular solute-binding protein [Gammaproteobacteria bacterium]